MAVTVVRSSAKGLDRGASFIQSNKPSERNTSIANDEVMTGPVVSQMERLPCRQRSLPPPKYRDNLVFTRSVFHKVLSCTAGAAGVTTKWSERLKHPHVSKRPKKLNKINSNSGLFWESNHSCATLESNHSCEIKSGMSHFHSLVLQPPSTSTWCHWQTACSTDGRSPSPSSPGCKSSGFRRSTARWQSG